MDKKIVISFPHLGNYYIPIHSFLSRLTNGAEIMIPPRMTKRTVELGEKHSPDFVCTPFKYNIGNYIESIEKGANVLMQAGGGCRFGYYAELQEQILKDLGYDFTLISLFNAGGIDLFDVYKKFKSLNPTLKFKNFIYHYWLTVKMVNALDDIETAIRSKVSFEINKGELNKIFNKFLKELKVAKNFIQVQKLRKKYLKLIDNVEIKKEKDYLRVGIVGEFYDVIEPYSNFYIEEELAKMNIEVRRYITVTYLLFKKGKEEDKLIDKSRKYIRYNLGADGTESVAHSKEMCEEGFDGIIHIKPFGCTPEINAMPILQKISKDYNVPIIYFTFDMLTSETGMKTRLEAFYDMLKMKKEANQNV